MVSSRSGHGYQFPPLFTNYLDVARKDHLSPLVILDFANKNYDGGHTPYTPEAIGAFARYCGAIVKRFPAINTYEVWNEYNGSFCDGPATADRAQHYSDLLHASYQAIKSRRPRATVVGGDTIGVPLPYIKKLIAHGSLDAMDVFSVHPYRYNDVPERLEEDIQDLRH